MTATSLAPPRWLEHELATVDAQLTLLVRVREHLAGRLTAAEAGRFVEIAVHPGPAAGCTLCACEPPRSTMSFEGFEERFHSASYFPKDGRL